MFSVTRLIHTSADADRDGLLAQLRALSTADRALVEPTLPGVRNGGDILMHLRFADRAQWSTTATELSNILSSPGVIHVDGVQYSGTSESTGTHPSGAVYRTLFMRIAPGTDEAVIGRFEDDLRLLPRFVPAITAWQLSRVESAIGSSPWTHVFEQEFCNLDGLMGPYLMHPVHWAYVDRWFDPECPEVVVLERVCHSFCPCEPAILAGHDGM